MNTVSTRSADVVVVGAGLAGLTAADELVRAGYDVLVVEGRDRVGGRILTTEIAGVPVDAGATWVAPGHTAMRDLVSRFGGEFVPQFHQGNGVLSFGGRRRIESITALAPWSMVDLWRVLNKVQKLVDGLPVSAPWEHPDAARLDAMSFGEWLTGQYALEDTRKFMTMLSLVHWGAPVGDVSLLNVLRYIKNLGGIEHMLAVEGGDQQDRILGTTYNLVNRLAGTLEPRVLLGSPVERITTTGERVTIETGAHTIEARYAIVTASPVHRSTIEFTPALPEPHYGLSRTWRLGALSKAFVAYRRPFWRDEGLSGQAMSDDETVFLTFDVSPSADGPGILMAFCDARGFDAYDEDERRRRVIRHLVHLYGEPARHALDYTDFSWGNDTFAPGGPNPAVGPKAWTTFGRFLREPVGLVHWAGTETADETSGTMNGAILSGRRAASEVATRLGRVLEPASA
ncbi:putative amine oxidoreductase [Actinoplanes missouriensis 431]|uniref:Putative amine oxidoreductase n=1 Tax=Actinoplanes missouriensis (strain ATCC 14538 / DSM 43046 / CBS 188.64 / JCM 3121 / NBRC 102363 / NCIMB 12654 / NRRL B-3342 / UNCC 431) TaxID=512565 RepID=I0H4I2_ACTM4|nr:flavin monoamine oxidase family protein [Actinoplanes missouriensis]BAL87919.1 putative amine oxidoreductase [Actinoplanes missouriensis 431]